MTPGTFFVGGSLALAGIASYVAAGGSSVTALIPAAFGVLMLLLALVSLSAKAHRHAIHVALVVALVGIAGTSMQVAKVGELFAGTAERPLAIIVSLFTFVVLVLYLATGIASFIRVRRMRSAQRAALSS